MLTVGRLKPFVLAALLSVPAAAQWSNDPQTNLPLADRTGTQTLPLVASTQDGGLYVAWFDGASGSFRVYLQRLNAAGVEQWAHNGLLVSSNPQNTALFGWDMIADSSGGAVLVFSDIRDGGDLDVHAYRVDALGQMLWGPDGVTLSANPDFEPAPRVAEASDGDFVFVWQRDPATGDGDIRMQRLSPAGVERFAIGGIAVVSAAGQDPGFVGIAAADNGSVVLSWLKDIRTFASNRFVRAQKFSSTGTVLWPAPVEVFDAFSVPIGYFPQIRGDGAGGAVLLWHRSDGTWFNSFVQRLDASGAELFPHNGVAVSTTANMHHIGPTLSRDPATGDLLVFWSEQVFNQSQWGLYGQKISAAGSRLWGNGGMQLLPVDTAFKSLPRSVPWAGGAMVVFYDTPSPGNDRILALRVDETGTAVWPGSTVVVSSAPGTKSRYPVTIDPSGVAKVVWEDNRGASTDLYGQNVAPDGSLGIARTPGWIGNGLVLDKSPSTPGNLVLTWEPSCSSGALGYAIYEGSLASYYSHVMKDCSDDGGDLREEILPAAGDCYYIVVALAATAEGSHGTDSGGAERPVPSPANRCLAAQELAACTP